MSAVRTLMATAAAVMAASAFVAGVVYADPEAPHGRKLGSQCAYAEHPGTCTILSVEKTPDSTAQASLSGGPGYEGLAVTFTYAGADAGGGDTLVQQAIEGRHELRLMNSWYPGPRFLERYGIAAGKSFECTLKIITQGTCTPTIIDFPHIDRADYFESQH